MSIQARQVADFLQVRLTGENLRIDRPGSSDQPEDNTLVFLKSPGKAELESVSKYRLVAIVPEDTVPEKGQAAFIRCANPRLAFAKVVSHYFDRADEPGIDSTAICAESANIGEGVSVGCLSVIGEKVEIGEGSIIRDHVVIHSNCRIGKNCLIKSGSVIGEEGFGFDFEEDGTPIRMPHVGSASIGDRVEIGSNTVVCRGTVGDTIIGDDVKINDLVHIAHNCRIGKNVIIAGGKLCGSVTLGNGVWISPATIIRNKVTIGENTTIGLGSVVTKDTEAGMVAYGNPAKVIRRKTDISD